MIERQRLKRILGLALPIIGGMVSQNVLNLVDTLMVGHLGKQALAAVGFGGFAFFLSSAFITGMSAGVQAMAARRKGEGREDAMAFPLNGGLLLAAVIAIPLSVLLIAIAPYAFSVLSSDPEVVDIGTPYLRVRLIAMVAIGMNYAFRGYWNGVDMSRIYLRTLLVMHACNIFLNFGLIFGYFGFPEMGATGAGIGTAASTFIGAAYYFYLGRRYATGAGFLRGVPDRATLKTMLRLSVPSGLQQMMFAGGLTVLFVIIDRVGTDEVAAANVLTNIALVAYLPALGLGLAAASLVGQALGRRDPADAERWGWDTVKVGMVALGLLGLPMWLVPELLLTPFFPNDPEPLKLAVLPLRITGAFMVGEAIGMVLLNALMGAGATATAATIAVGLQWGLFLPVAYVVGPVLGFGLIGIWIANIGYRAILAGTFAAVWKSRRWTSVNV